MRSVTFDPNGFDHPAWWMQQDRKTALRIVMRIKEIQRTPFEGTGKPEPLKHELKGCWSRRITKEHRLVYEVQGNQIRILACRFHYGA